MDLIINILIYLKHHLPLLNLLLFHLMLQINYLLSTPMAKLQIQKNLNTIS
jgi:hypothetical protein